MMLASIRAIANSTPGSWPILLQPGRHRPGIGEVAELRRAVEGRRGEGHHRDGADDDKHDADPEIDRS